MKTELIFKNTIEFFFEKCSSRVKKKIEQKNLALKTIYPVDEKLISHIQNNKRYPNKNRYLLTDTVIPNDEEINANNIKIGLAPMLFNNDIQALLWGTNEEIIQNLPDIFNCIIKDLLETFQKYNINIHLILSDYAPYAFNWTYHNLLTKNNVTDTDYSYGVIPKKISSNLPVSQKIAIYFLYKKCEEKFKENFFIFAQNTTSYSKIDKVFEKTFIIKKFIPLLKEYIPQEDSIGLRVQHLIMTDISKSSNLIAQHSNQNSFTELNRKLVGLSSQYAHELIKLQEEYLPLFIEKHSHQYKSENESNLS